MYEDNISDLNCMRIPYSREKRRTFISSEFLFDYSPQDHHASSRDDKFLSKKNKAFGDYRA